MKVMAAQINPTIGDIEGNTNKVLKTLDRARDQHMDIVLFPELTLTGYFPDDLLLDLQLIETCAKQLERIAPATENLFAAVGFPRRHLLGKEKFLFNSAAVFANGKLLGYQDKILLPTYDVFDERRFFEPGGETHIWEYCGDRIAVTICEDIWQHADAVSCTKYCRDPVMELKDQNPSLVLNLSGSPYSFDRKKKRLFVVQTTAKTLQCPVILCNQVGANDQLIFDGHSLYVNGKGELMQIASGFVEEDCVINLDSTAHLCIARDDGIQDLYSALVLGVRDYFHKQGFKQAILGLSGGIDSALVACIAKEALGEKNVSAFSLPSRFSSSEGMMDARQLAQKLEVEFIQISIDATYESIFDVLSPLFGDHLESLTEENIQARIRMLILMVCSNQTGSLLLNTGNKSEMAMGYTTLYGDLAGGLGVLQDVTKSRIYQLGAYINRREEVIPWGIIKRPPSPELREGQTDSDSLPPFEILDSVIEDYIEEQLGVEAIAKKRSLSMKFVLKLIHQIHLAEYKRRQAPIGLRVTQKAFTKGRFVPIAQKWL